MRNIHLRLSLPWVGLPGATEGCRGECPTVALLGFMVHILAEKPSAFKSGEEGDIYYALHTDEEIYAYACLNFAYPPVAILHLEVRKFSHNILKLLKKDRLVCLSECKKHNCHLISITKEGSFESNKTWMKFVRHFGFENFVQYTGSTQIIGS